MHSKVSTEGVARSVQKRDLFTLRPLLTIQMASLFGLQCSLPKMAGLDEDKWLQPLEATYQDIGSHASRDTHSHVHFWSFSPSPSFCLSLSLCLDQAIVKFVQQFENCLMEHPVRPRPLQKAFFSTSFLYPMHSPRGLALSHVSNMYTVYVRHNKLCSAGLVCHQPW